MKAWAAAAALALLGCTGEGAAEEVSYHADVAPLLARHCLSCHDRSGVAPLSLRTFEDVVAVAPRVVEAVSTRRMPPWAPDASGRCNTFRDARWLAEEDIDTIERWVASGMSAGDPREPPSRPVPPRLPRVDVRLDPGTSHVPAPTDGDEDQHCFVVEPDLERDRFVTAFEFHPGTPDQIHHVSLYLLPDGPAEEARARHEASGGAGYTCHDGPGAGEAAFVAGWAPGSGVTRLPEGTGVRLVAGQPILMELHYIPRVSPTPDRTTVDLELADEVTREAVVTWVSSHDLFLPPRMERVETVDELEAPLAGQILGVAPHMHTLGRALRVEVGTADAMRCLVDAPRYRFEWQQFYFLEEPVALSATDTVRIRCTYDTTERSDPVEWGSGSTDEMCLNSIYVVPE